MKKIVGLCFLALMIPYIVTLAWTGRVEGSIQKTDGISKKILLDRGAVPSVIDVEEYLIGMVALQIPAYWEPETLKAQAMIARTYLYKQMGDAEKIPESELKFNYLEESGLEEIWGKDKFLEYYKNIRDAVEETRGQVIKYEENLIDPLFHQVSAGKTRSGDEMHPYIKATDGHLDMEAENYMSLKTFTKEEFAAALNAMEDSPNILPEQALESIQIVEKDETGYVTTLQVGMKSYSGEEVAYVLGLKSCAFSFEDYEGSIRCTTKGIGHGYGFDQYGANLKAKEGWRADELLNFYYKNIVVISE